MCIIHDISCYFVREKIIILFLRCVMTLIVLLIGPLLEKTSVPDIFWPGFRIRYRGFFYVQHRYTERVIVPDVGLNSVNTTILWNSEYHKVMSARDCLEGMLAIFLSAILSIPDPYLSYCPPF